MRLDFSQFHPLDHRIGGARCRSFPGGWLHHAVLAWQFGPTRDRLSGWAHRLVLCRIGRHSEGIIVDIDGGREIVRPICFYCPWERLPSEDDIDTARVMGRFFSSKEDDDPP